MAISLPFHEFMKSCGLEHCPVKNQWKNKYEGMQQYVQAVSTITCAKTFHLGVTEEMLFIIHRTVPSFEYTLNLF